MTHTNSSAGAPQPNTMDPRDDSKLFYREHAIGTRLRRLFESMSGDCDLIYKEAGVTFRVSHYYLIYALSEKGALTSNELTYLSGFSQPAISQTIGRLKKEGWIEAHTTEDGRQKLISLTRAGCQLVEKIRPIWAGIKDAVNSAIDETGMDFIDNLDRLETALERETIYSRYKRLLPVHPAKDTLTQVIPYHVDYKEDFYRLNTRWLEAYFHIEPIDTEVLTKPDDYILDHGGEILFALHKGKAVGCAALKNDGNGVFEFTKFAVDPDVQGLGIGGKLMEACTARFKARGGKKLYLETNTKLQAARRLYLRYNWVDVHPERTSPYARCNCTMVWQEGTSQKDAK